MSFVNDFFLFQYKSKYHSEIIFIIGNFHFYVHTIRTTLNPTFKKNHDWYFVLVNSTPYIMLSIMHFNNWFLLNKIKRPWFENLMLTETALINSCCLDVRLSAIAQYPLFWEMFIPFSTIKFSTILQKVNYLLHICFLGICQCTLMFEIFRWGFLSVYLFRLILWNILVLLQVMHYSNAIPKDRAIISFLAWLTLE